MAPRIVLITGCSTGIGLSTAVLLAKDAEKRFKVYATMRNLEKRHALEEAAKEQLGSTLIIKKLDVISDENVSEVFQSIYDEEGRIDVLVNNAGRGLMGVLEAHSMDLVRKMFDINFFGVLRTTRLALPKMKANKEGHIINISSMAGINGVPFNGIYCATKFAVEGLSESLAPLLRKFNVRVTLIEPGPVTSAFVTNAQSQAPVVDDEGVDEETRQLLQNAKAKLQGAMVNMAQSSDEIAQSVLDVLVAEKPPLRIQTNKHYAAATASKYTDPSGDKSVDMMFTRFFS